MTNRTLQEFFRQGNVSFRHTLFSCFEGICSERTGTVTAQICDNHEPGDDSLCPHCRQQYTTWNFGCDVCKGRYNPVGWASIFTEMAVLSFRYERRLDVYTVYDMQAWQHVNDSVETTVSSRDPLEITVTVELEGDRLTVTLDDDANVVDIDETTDEA